MPETDPLLSNSNSGGGGSARFYFLNKEQSGSSFKGDSTTAVEAPPPGATEEEFAPRPVGKHVVRACVFVWRFLQLLLELFSFVCVFDFLVDCSR